jgi:NAD(P)-dependent dehydrogenase (short-subunit alcohol dehydrogenase family)
MQDYYQNKVAVVTGGASGIGLGLCELLLSLGARVVLADIHPARLQAEGARLEASYAGQTLAVLTDVASPSSLVEMTGKAAEFGAGRIDFLFANAGLSLYKAFDESTEQDWRRAFEINFFGTLHGIQAVLPIMRAQGGGHIACTASGIAFSPMAFQSMYSATKAALVALSLSLRYELWDDNIRVCPVIPGTVATPIWDAAGGPPPEAISPAEAAHEILRGVAANERIVFVTECDREGAANAYSHEVWQGKDAYFLDNARRRRGGQATAL